MKRFFLLFALIVFSISVFAVECPSERELNAEATKCKELGKSYEYYTKEKCKYVQCVELKIAPIPTAPLATITCPSPEELEKEVSSCKAQGLSYEYYAKENCRYVNCVKPQATVCSSEDALAALKQKCYNAGLEPLYNYKDGCPTIECKQSKVCPEREELDKQVIACKERGLDYSYEKDSSGCAVVKCGNPVSCLTIAEIEKDIARCRESGLEHEIFADAVGCRKVSCKQPVSEIVQCKKYKNEQGCILISCTDGFYYDSCVQESVCKEQRVECTKTKDENGCIVKVCSDGFEAIGCPTEKIECRVYKDEQGCEVKECTDGYKAKYCPVVQCKVYTDDGCKIKECSDGYKAKECPREKRDLDIECKVFTDEKGCVKKTCTNGFVSDSCLQQKVACKVTKDKQGCEVKVCENGYEAKNCPTKTEAKTECRVIKEGECEIKTCTDGYTAKECPKEEKALEKPAPRAKPAEEPEKRETIIDVLLKIFGFKK